MAQDSDFVTNHAYVVEAFLRNSVGSKTQIAWVEVANVDSTDLAYAIAEAVRDAVKRPVRVLEKKITVSAVVEFGIKDGEE